MCDDPDAIVIKGPVPKGPPAFEKFANMMFAVLDTPVTKFRETFVDPIREKNRSYYYHRRFRRVPTIDECDISDEVCKWEANEQYKRDRLVDSEILSILRNRRIQCEVYYGRADMDEKCKKTVEDYEEASGNWFAKYGDLGAIDNVVNAYMKQKHRMIFERRHGPVGCGVKSTKLSVD